MGSEPTAWSEPRFPIDPHVADFPFRTELSLAPLVAQWTRAAAEPGVAGEVARAVQSALARAPELAQPIDDLAVLERHRELVDVLMSRVFPPAAWDRDVGAAMVPFRLQPIHRTPTFRRLFTDGDGMVRGVSNIDGRTVPKTKIWGAYEIILRQFYGIDLRFEYPILVTVPDPETGLDRHYKIAFDPGFVEVHAVGPAPPLPEADRRRLLASLGEPDALLEILPPDRFAFRGFSVIRGYDVTDSEVLSGLKRDLIEKESIVSDVRFEAMQAKLRTLFRLPDLRFGIAAIQGERVFVLNYGCEKEHDCIFADSVHQTKADFAASIYERAIELGKPLIIEDLAAYPGRTKVEEGLLQTGMRSVIVAPLYYQDELIGSLDLGAPQTGALNSVNALKLAQVLPLFSMAVKRGVEELNARVEAVIKEKCTAIHPTVEWRFRRAVLDAMERSADGAAIDLEPIVFKSVHPLYAVSDIRGSSDHRNAAVQADLTAHLRLARDVVQAARAARPLPILDELDYRIGRHTGQIEQGLGSGDESAALAFLRHDVEPRFAELETFGPAIRERLLAYRGALDPSLGTIYRRRKEYEESVTLINDTVSAYLDAEQDVAQAMFPHYFEKQRTDGVDYTIYVGAALVEDGAFDELYLKNLRLWQLMVTCGVVRQTDALRSRLRVPLETAHLVLVQHAPLAISFRFDEKRFDVDGAYNVRYEVLKKRIDKAAVKGSTERVTQPGRIAIVYSHPAEALEYRQYLDYLRASGYLAGPVEELDLEDLQGVQGLRALRVAVDVRDAGPARRPPAARAAAEGVQLLGR